MTLRGPSWKPAAREVCLQEFENEVGSAAAVATAKPSRALQSDHALRTSPLAVSNWIHGDPSFLKVRELIEVVDPELSVTDRKLLDAMLAHATDSVVNVVASGRSQPGTILYSALATDIKRAMGWEGHKSNKSLLAAAKKLQGSVITIGYFAPGDDNLRHMNISLVTLSDVPENQGIVYWRFSPELEKLMSVRGERFLVQLKVLAKLTSGYSHRLYQLLCANADRETFSWTVSVGDLRQVLNAAAASYDSWGAFERRVLRVAVEEINRYAAFRVRYELIADERTRRRTHVTFVVEGPTGTLPPPKMEASRQESSGQLALDLLPITAGLEISPVALGRRLTKQARERLRTDYAGAPIDNLIVLWSEWCARNGVKVDRPARVFERWITTMFGDLVLQGRDGRPADWIAAMTRDLDQPNCRAMFLLSNMVAQQRQRWLNLARSKAVDRAPRSKALGSSVDAVHFHEWVHFILEEFSMAHPL